MKSILTAAISTSISFSAIICGVALADDAVIDPTTAPTSETSASESSESTDSKAPFTKPNAPYVDLAPRIAPQPLAGVTIVYDSITPPNQLVFPGMIRAYSDAGQGQSIGGQHLGEWWRGGWAGPKREVDERFLRQRVRSLPPKSMWIVDIEHWPYDLRNASETEVEESVRKMRRILAIVRDERPDLCIGSYASIPSDYWSIVQYRMALDVKLKAERGEQLSQKDHWWLASFESFQTEFLAWQRACDRMQFGMRDDGSIDRNGGLIDALDVMTPTCYLVGDADDGMEDPQDIASDRLHLTETMRGALRVGGGRPVIPYMMYTVTESSVPADRLLIRPKRLRAALEALRDAGASGVIMWGWTRGRPLDEPQAQAMQIALDVFGKYTPGKPSERR